MLKDIKNIVLCKNVVIVCLIFGILIGITTYYRANGITEEIVSIVGLISGILIGTCITTYKMYYRVSDITGEDRSIAYGLEKQYDNRSIEAPTDEKEIEGLPKSEQIPEDKYLAKLDNTALLKIYWRYINKLQILCKDIICVGSLEGLRGKEICIDPGYKPEAPCLVYSFGIANQFDFDEAVVEKFGCDVHCFDPSMTMKTKRVSEHIWFYDWGIGGKDEISSKNWNIKTLDTIRRELGHTNRTLDILKIDVEGDEWNALPQIISSGTLDYVRQISMEVHFTDKNPGRRNYWGNVHPRKQLQCLRQLYDKGYRIFMRERNMWSHSMWSGIKGFITTVNEITMVKPTMKKNM